MDFKNIKGNLNIAITLHIFFVAFITLMRDYGSEIGLNLIKNRDLLSYTLPIIFYFFSLGFVILIEHKEDQLKKPNNSFRWASKFIAISFISLGIMIFSFIGTQRNYPDTMILIFNILFSLTIWVVSLMPILVFCVLGYGFFFKNEI